jgi:glycosyltransferase involved in cell wall biosynthesis
MLRLKVAEEKILVIPNGVDVAKFYPVPKEEARKKLGVPHKRVLLSVGHLVPEKGFDLILQALKLLVEEWHEEHLYLVVIGDGRLRKELEQMVAGLNLEAQVSFVGNVPHQELHLWYSAADLFCLASSREGWPNVLLESLACGTPVVATDVGGIPEIIRSEQIGLLTQRSAREIAAGIARGLNRPWQSDAIIEYAREHTWERVALSVLQAFTSALQEKEP